MRFLFLVNIAFLLSLFSSPPALAMENITYVDFQNSSATKQLLSYLQKEEYGGVLDSLVAHVDLNDDGLNEFILRQCPSPPALCTYSIWAERTKSYIEIGKITALRLTLGAEKRNGVHDLRAYHDPINDYNSIVYVWDAMDSRYIKE